MHLVALKGSSVSTGNAQSPHLAMDVRCVQDKSGGSLIVAKNESKLRDLWLSQVMK